MASPDVTGPLRRLRPSFARRPPLLVTGMPRSGTTWLARALAGAPGTGLPGREPVNPRPGQFGLAGTLDSWTELTDPTPRQVRVLRRVYSGLELRTYSRYGLGSLGAALPWRTTIVKDPFALLSVPAIVSVTGAKPIVVYRHAGAVLASYRRMGWEADVQEMRRLQGSTAPPPAGDLDAMVEFWTFMHARVLDWLPRVPGALLVSHAEVTRGGAAAIARLAALCGLEVPRTAPTPSERATRTPVVATGPAVAGGGAQPRLHTFAREPEEVATGWRSRLGASEVERLERGTTSVWDEMESARTPLVGT